MLARVCQVGHSCPTRELRKRERMLSAFANAFKTPDLRKKILFTLFILAVFRFGSVLPAPT